MKMIQFVLLFCLFTVLNANAQIYGCTDPLSSNYNPAATISDGSCSYASASVSPAASVTLPASVIETSGLIKWGDYLYTHNDNTDKNLYALNPSTGAIMQTIALTGVTNQDWEEIAQDQDYVYIGDFGNNSGGVRTNLKILKISKASIQAGTPSISIINFSYSDQVNFTNTGSNNTDFDCEAFVVANDNIYLFTKQWVSKKTSVYSLPKTAGTYVAQLQSTFNVNGLVTGATYLEEKRLVVLCGYSSTMSPFLYLLYDFNGHNFFGGNKRKLSVPLMFHQTEGIATTNGLDFYVSNEKLTQSFITTAQKLHRFNLRPYLEGYIASQAGAPATTWNGTAWSNGVPVSDQYAAVIEGNYNSAENGEINAASLEIRSGNVTIASGDNFIVKGVVKVAEGANFIIENNANLLQVDDVQNSGVATIKKISNPLYYLDYTLWTSPVHGNQTLKQFSPATLDKRFYVYNTVQDSYDNYESASGILDNPTVEHFTTGKSYLIRMPYGLPQGQTSLFNGDFQGTPNNGTINYPLETGELGVNAVGNPYPSPLNINDFLDANQSKLQYGSLYFWRKTNNPDATSYATINKLAYIANAAEGGDAGSDTYTGDPTQWVVNPGQGFFVVSHPNAGNLVFTNSMRRPINNGQFFRQAQNTETASLSRLWINIANENGGFSQAAVGFTPEGTTGLDYGLDGLVLSESATTIYTLAGETKLAIQARPAFTTEDVVPVGYNAAAAGTYTISLNNADGVFAQEQQVYLKDKQLNIIHNLSSNAYSFSSEQVNSSDRFELIFADASLGIDENNAPVNDVVVYKQDNTIHVDAGSLNINEVILYDINGRKIYGRNNIGAAQADISGIQAKNQVLIINVTLADNRVVTKKVMN